MSDELRDQIQEFLTFPEDSAGRIMQTDYTAFHHRATLKQAVSQLRARVGIQRAPSNIFVIDDEHKLLGVIRMRDMLIADENTRLKELMNPDVFTVNPFDEKAEAFRILSGKGFTSLPVVDSQGHLLGVVRATNLLEQAQETATRDMQKLFGAGKDERTFSPIGFSLRKRLPWLHVNLATAFLAASVVALFEGVIAKITILAVYLPVVAGQGGNAGAQSLALVMRGLVMREIPSPYIKRMLLKESIIGSVNGLVIGVVTAAIAWMWNGNIFLGLVIGLAMIINLAVAGLAGAAIPITMKRLGLDPAQSSSIVLTTITDVVGFFAFLSIAMLLQSFLI
jgi:magnesium transporter